MFKSKMLAGAGCAGLVAAVLAGGASAASANKQVRAHTGFGLNMQYHWR